MIIRWQMGPYHDGVSWQALSCSVRLMHRLEPDAKLYVIHQGKVPEKYADLPVSWIAQDVRTLPDFPYGRHRPNRIDSTDHEVWFDNDHIMWGLPPGWKEFASHTDKALVWRCDWGYYGSYTHEIKGRMGEAWDASAGMWGLAPGMVMPEFSTGQTVSVDHEEYGFVVNYLSQQPEASIWENEEVTAFCPTHPVMDKRFIGRDGTHLMAMNRGWNAEGEKLLGWIEREWLGGGMVGEWDWSKVRQVHDDTTMKMAVEWCDAVGGTLADWGGGHGRARDMVSESYYVALDGSVGKPVDLRTVSNLSDSVVMRHVLEHNLRWREVLENMLSSFTKRAALVLFITPDEEADWNTRWDDFVPYLNVCKWELELMLAPYYKRVEYVGDEVVYFLERS